MAKNRQNRTFVLIWIFSLCSVYAGLNAAQAQTKSQPRLALSHSEEFLNLVKALNAQSCVHDVPAPTLLQEPRYTIGTTNSICFQLPSSETISFSPDTVKSPFVITLLDDGSGAAPLEFPRPVDLEDTTIQVETIAVLDTGVRYGYTTALFLPVCTIECADVTDASQLELHCSAYQDTVFSTQDASAPTVQDVRIPELISSPVSGWSNQTRVEVVAQLLDPAGVW